MNNRIKKHNGMLNNPDKPLTDTQQAAVQQAIEDSRLTLQAFGWKETAEQPSAERKGL